MSYDIIGDVHRHADKLGALLRELGYQNRRGAWRHSSRTVIFVGDLIDRGPGQLRTLNLVRAMIDAGAARAVMGNHEFNAIAWASADPLCDGLHLRTRLGEKGRKNLHQHQAFLAEVGPDSADHQAWIRWFLDLPVWIEEPGLRVIHACWSPKHAALLGQHLRPGARMSPELVEAASRQGSDLYDAVDTLLKGQEAKLPGGHWFKDKEGHVRHEIRVRWWAADWTTFRGAYIGPDGADIPEAPLDGCGGLAEPDRPTFIGHYWLDPQGPFEPLSSRVVCVDYSAARGGPLVAYRFDGEPALSAQHFVVS